MPSFIQLIGLWALLSLGSVLANFQGIHEERIRSDSPRVIHFAGLDWQVKAGRGLGPGNNNWSDSPQSVWVDSDARLHLRIRKEGATWYSAQINSVDFVPFGLYRFFVQTSLHDLDDNVVLGLFLYGDDDHEIDIEFLRRHPASDANMVYVVQPYSQEGNRHPFLWQWAGPSIHDIEWQPDGITFRSIRGHDLRLESLMHLWRYEGTSIPVTQDGLHVQMNLWLLDPSTQSQEVEIIIADLEAPPTSTSP
jgi:hypothetical protein